MYAYGCKGQKLTAKGKWRQVFETTSRTGSAFCIVSSSRPICSCLFGLTEMSKKRLGWDEATSTCLQCYGQTPKLLGIVEKLQARR